jgi:type II secretory pathway component PulF
MIEEMVTSIKGNIESKILLTQHIQEIRDNMKRQNLRIIDIEQGEKNLENIFHKIIEEKFSKLKKEMPIKLQVAYGTPNRLDQKKSHLSKQ